MNSISEFEDMSRAPKDSKTNEDRAEKPSWSFWARQTLAIMNLEIRNNFFSRRALLFYLIAASPLFLLSTFAIFRLPNDNAGGFANLHSAFAGIYGGLILRTLVFFGCAWVFMNLFRGEVIDRSLHYYFLSPVRREILVVGKYLSGVLATITIFGATTVGSMLIFYFSIYPSDAARFFFEANGAAHLLSYLAVTVLACIGYGAVFLLVGLFFRNPVVPGLLLYGWEFINFLLPPFLKKLSVIHYLHSLVPVPLSEGPFAVLVEPTPSWIAVPGLFLLTAVLLFVAGRYIRRMEIRYTAD